MAISQILYSQYMGFIWDSYVLGLKTKVFCRKKPNAQNHRQETYSAKMGAVVWPKIPQMPQIFMAQFLGRSPNVWDFLGIRSP